MLKDFTKMETFLVVSKEKSFSKASAKLGISQPAVTQQIKFIEDYLDTKVIERKKNGIRLTKSGASGNKKVALKDFLKQQQKVQDKDVKLNAIATVKLNSDKNIYAKDSEKVNFYFILTAVNLIQKL